MALTLTSNAFEHMGNIPTIHTCQGPDISPQLQWSDIPEGTESLVLIVDDPDAPDPDAPKMTWVHWVVYNIPATMSSLPEAIETKALEEVAQTGTNDFKHNNYGGPCPPIGTHRYFFKLYALDTILPQIPSANKENVLKAMSGHILEHTELVGCYIKN
jgi:Raf kinase inhibitor-like YbhB/YbcL family protein